MSEVVIERSAAQEMGGRANDPDGAERGVYQELAPFAGVIAYKVIDSSGELLARVEMVPRAKKHLSRSFLTYLLDTLDPVR